MFASKVPSTPHTKKLPHTGEDQRPFFRLAVQQAEVPRRHCGFLLDSFSKRRQIGRR